MGPSASPQEGLSGSAKYRVVLRFIPEIILEIDLG